MANQAEIATEKNLPRGSQECLPSRGGGIGKEKDHPANPLDDEYTEQRRAKYGEVPRGSIISGETRNLITDTPNDIESKQNITMRRNIILDPSSGYGRTMCQ